jgi:hypothetical protein
MAGDRIIAHSGSTVINRSEIENAFNRLEAEASPDTKKALREVAQAIEKSGNKSAAVVFEQLLDEIGNEKSNRSSLRDYWKTITQLVPDVVKMADAVAKITALF